MILRSFATSLSPSDTNLDQNFFFMLLLSDEIYLSCLVLKYFTIALSLFRGIARDGDTPGGSAWCHPLCVTHCFDVTLYDVTHPLGCETLYKIMSKSKWKPKKRSSPKIHWVFGSNVDGDPINCNKESSSQISEVMLHTIKWHHPKLVIPWAGSPPSDATERVYDCW